MSTIQLAKTTFNKKLIYGLLGAGSITIIGSQLYQDQQSKKYYKFPNNNQNHKNYGKALIAGSGLNVALASKDHEGDYQKIYNDIASKIRDNDEYDEYIGFGPVLVRLAWHLSGTFAKKGYQGCPHQTGGSYGGSIRIDKEAKDPANNGLQNGRWFLEEFKTKYPWISYGDLYTLGGVVAIQEMGGPKIGWRHGRKDQGEDFAQTSRLPDASQGADYVRGLFGRMGFNDREVVCLIGAHALGSCHVLAPALPGQEKSNGPGSGYTGRWTASPNFFTNEFYKLLVDEKWEFKDWSGPRQYENKDGLMMLPADYALVQDPKYKEWVVKYAKDQDLFFKDFAKDFQKLLELGIEFPRESKVFYFQTLDEQE